MSRQASGTMLNAGNPTYGPSEAALEALSAIMAKDLDGTVVTVNVLVPHRADPLSPDRLGRRQDRGIVCRSVCGGAPPPAPADHPRSRRHRRPAARASGGTFFSRLL